MNLDNFILMEVRNLPSHARSDSVTLTDLLFGKPYGKAGLNRGNWKPNLESPLAK